MANPRADQLKRVPLFAELGRKDLEFLAQYADEVSVPAGEQLITENAPNDTFFVMLEGKVDVEVGGKHRRSLGPGECFGEISMSEHTLATATCKAVTALTLLVLGHSQFRAVKGQTAVMTRIVNLIAERLAADRSARGD